MTEARRAAAADALCDAVCAAGAAVLKRFKARAPGEIEKKRDGSPVSDADHEADAILRERLSAYAPSYGWISEESGGENDPNAPFWLVDPIDGTRAFLSGAPDFVVAGALIEGGRPVATAIFAPAKDELFIAHLGGGATLNGAPARASAAQGLEGARILAPKSLLKRPEWSAPWPEARILYRAALSYRLAMIAAGRAEAMLKLGAISPWDAAPGALLAAEAGAVVADHRGRALRFAPTRDPLPSLVAAAPGVAEDVAARLRDLPETLPR